MNDMKKKSNVTETAVGGVIARATPHFDSLREDLKQARLFINGSKPRKAKAADGTVSESSAAKRRKS